MNTSPEDIWRKLSKDLPKPSEEVQEMAKKQWMLQKLAQNDTSSQEDAQIVMKAIFDDGFYQEASKEMPTKQAKTVSMHRWTKWASAVAAMLLFAFGLHWAGDDTMVYAQAMAKITESPVQDAAYLGGTYEVFNDLASLKNTLSILAEEQQGVAIPEQAVTVKEIGAVNGISYFDISQGEHTVRVLTQQPLPKKGEVVSFNAQATAVRHFGREIVLLVEVARHEVY